MRLQFPFLCRVRNRLAPRESPRWRPKLGRGARGLPIAAASLALLVGAGAAGFATSATHTYVVQPGDSLWAISRANGLTVQQLAAANSMNPNDLLLIGRHLVIPSNQPATPSAAPASATGGSSRRGRRLQYGECLDLLLDVEFRAGPGASCPGSCRNPPVGWPCGPCSTSGPATTTCRCPCWRPSPGRSPAGNRAWSRPRVRWEPVRSCPRRPASSAAPWSGCP